MLNTVSACLLTAAVTVGVTFKAMSDPPPAPRQPTPEPAPATPASPPPELSDVFAVQITAPSGKTDFDVVSVAVGAGGGEPFLFVPATDTQWTFLLKRSGGQHVVIVANP